jgi:hypothetical protein
MRLASWLPMHCPSSKLHFTRVSELQSLLLTTSVFNAPEQPVATRSGLDTRTAG